jgi:uncharacterized protein YdeI (YjbR/CyaY-like superfamily)
MKVSGGTVHKLPKDLKAVLVSDAEMRAVWEDITPLARNEWICWVTSAKKDETRAKRIEVGRSQMHEGQRRPCCWPGCKHR